MVAEIRPRLTFVEYLDIEGKAEFKSELINGQLYAMAGASPNHNLITANVTAEFVLQLKTKPCRVYSSDQLLKIPVLDHGRYPDVTVVCGMPQFQNAPFLSALLNPTLLVEVLSQTTEAYDRSVKAEEYRTVPSLQEYLLIAQNRCHVEHYARQSDRQWLLTEFNRVEECIVLPSLKSTLAIADIYGKVDFPLPDQSS